MAVLSPMILSWRRVWDEMKFVRETITSSTGPRSSPGGGGGEDGAGQLEEHRHHSTEQTP